MYQPFRLKRVLCLQTELSEEAVHELLQANFNYTFDEKDVHENGGFWGYSHEGEVKYSVLPSGFRIDKNARMRKLSQRGYDYQVAGVGNFRNNGDLLKIDISFTFCSAMLDGLYYLGLISIIPLSALLAVITFKGKLTFIQSAAIVTLFAIFSCVITIANNHLLRKHIDVLTKRLVFVLGLSTVN